ncbi:MAG: hypothetical protein KJ650_06050 [Firmicutes bacterium]|nr:hypothetical protein [Bacillota bacterium]MBU4533181.1 hypothetical protein [Bacillota bacterium]MBU4554511.1 hypothetical protein [Bacillota bacterium]
MDGTGKQGILRRNVSIIPDILGDDLRIVFVGYNPGERAAQVGHHFAGRNKGFWRLLFEAGVTPRLLLPEEDHKLLNTGVA